MTAVEALGVVLLVLAALVVALQWLGVIKGWQAARHWKAARSWSTPPFPARVFFIVCVAVGITAGALARVLAR